MSPIHWMLDRGGTIGKTIDIARYARNVGTLRGRDLARED